MLCTRPHIRSVVVVVFVVVIRLTNDASSRLTSPQMAYILPRRRNRRKDCILGGLHTHIHTHTRTPFFFCSSRECAFDAICVYAWKVWWNDFENIFQGRARVTKCEGSSATRTVIHLFAYEQRFGTHIVTINKTHTKIHEFMQTQELIILIKETHISHPTGNEYVNINGLHLFAVC